MAITRQWRSFALLLSASTVTVTMILTVQLLSARPAYLEYKTSLAQAVSLPMRPSRIPASWVTSGSPEFSSTSWGESQDGSSRSGLWQCVGPGEFTWHYDEDESIYVIEGGAEIEYLGKKFRVNPGDSTRFVAGTTAKWTVHDHIKKTWTLYEPGSLVRTMRRLFS